MPPKPPSLPAPPSRTPAPHVQASVARAAQAKQLTSPGGMSQVPVPVPASSPRQAAHVRQALTPIQPKRAQSATKSDVPAPHVQNIMRPVQAKPSSSPRGPGQPALHVQAMLGKGIQRAPNARGLAPHSPAVQKKESPLRPGVAQPQGRPAQRMRGGGVVQCLKIIVNVGAGDKLMPIDHFGKHGEVEPYAVFNFDSGHMIVSDALQGMPFDELLDFLKGMFKGSTEVNKVLSTKKKSDWEAYLIKELFDRFSLTDIKQALPVLVRQEVLKRELGPRGVLDPNFEIATADYVEIQPGCVDVLYSISPFGYKPVNAETSRMLKRGGVLIIAANSGNNFAKKPVEGELEALGMEEIKLGDINSALIDKALSMGSVTTHGSETALNLVKVFRKL